MKKILLAGGAGYIGTELCKRLQRLDYKVTVIDELWFGNNLNPKVEFKYQKFKRFREFSFCLKHLTIISVKH